MNLIKLILPSLVLGLLLAGLSLWLYNIFGYDIKNHPDKLGLMIGTIFAFMCGVMAGVHPDFHKE
jgi:hypothetical protein